jgi:glycosyltransferase involved in cell wall biosynthesis
MVDIAPAIANSIAASSFPPAPDEHQGWPWQPVAALPAITDLELPTISVITPSYNQGQFIEQTIRSVLLQSYPKLEYIIIDGGSTDDTLSIIRRYQPWLTYWVSEPDRGQSHAINKGFAQATGEILCWLNSDDFYLPETLLTVGRKLAAHTGNYALVGHCLKVYVDENAPVKLEGRYEDRRRLLEFWRGYQMHQPAIFWRKEVFAKVGELDESLDLIMDFDYWARISEHFTFVNVDQVLAACNYHSAAKTGDDYKQYHKDLRRYSHRYWGPPSTSEFWQLQWAMAKHFSLRPIRNLGRRFFGKFTSSAPQQL